MKHLLFLFLGLITFSACHKETCEESYTYTIMEPVVANRAEIRAKIKVESPRALVEAGKIYVFGQYLLISEKEEGLHIVDNADPLAPTTLAFLAIPGNTDMAVQGNQLYANSYVDLLTFDFSDPRNPRLTGALDNFLLEGQFNTQITNEQLVIDFKETTKTETYDCSEWGKGGGWAWNEDFISNGPSVNGQGSGGGAPSTGVGGSMARFTIAHQLLYTVSESLLNVYEVTAMDTATLVTSIQAGWGIETIFTDSEFLYLGTQTGMITYSLSAPRSPSFVSVFRHASACDPVFIQGDKAYVTLRNGTPCDQGLNQLLVLDITDRTNPVLIKTYDMQNPHGLSVMNDRLFICEGAFGFKGFDKSDDLTITDHSLFTLTDFDAYDVIALPRNNDNNTLLIVTGKDGIFQFNYDGQAITALSSIR